LPSEELPESPQPGLDTAKQYHPHFVAVPYFFS
jgi:hypothetical protein